MALGPGKYDSACTLAREMTKADACILIVVNGTAGSGFSVQAPLPLLALLPVLLRNLADQIEADVRP